MVIFILYVFKNTIEIRETETITSGSVGVYTIRFKFNSIWKNLEKMVIFSNGKDMIATLLDDDNQCTVPWEVLQFPNRELKVGVYGTRDGTVVLPTVWISLGKIKQGVPAEANNAQEPTPEIVNQILAAVQEIKEIVPEPMTSEELQEIINN